MRYKQGDKVRVKSLAWYNENKNDDNCIDLIRDNDRGFNFIETMAAFCGKVMTISDISCDYYNMLEDSGEYYWTDEMFEGLAQEYPKIAIQGDPAKGVSVIDALVALGGENEKDVIASTKHACYFIDHDGKIRSRLLENIPEGFKLYTLEEWRKENMEKENADKKELLLGLVETQKGQELIPHKDYEIKQDGDKFYLVKKKKEYPKTYEECCKIMQVARPFMWFNYSEVNSISQGGDEYERHMENTLCVLRRLLICRDAYWKIAGEEMGLGKPWEPDFDNLSTNLEYMKIDKGCFTYSSRVFVFPTEEMRDAFKENFDPDIEICKEFL